MATLGILRTLNLRLDFQGKVNRGCTKNAELSDRLYQIRGTEVTSVSRKWGRPSGELGLGSEVALEAAPEQGEKPVSTQAQNKA